MARNDRIPWDAIKRRIRRGKVTPIIGDRVGHDGFLTSDELIQKWAEKVGYPWGKTRNITRVAQYRGVTLDPLGAKEEYLDFLKGILLNNAWDQPNPQEDFLDTLEEEIDDLTFSEVAKKLKYPDLAGDKLNALQILARFDIPIYITTSFHNFMYRALDEGPKSPKYEICPWYPGVNDQRSLLDTGEYQDDPQKPMIYHLHGHDSKPSSLVFTEDDFIDYLVAISQDPNVIPKRIKQAMSDTSLLLLGYDLQDWDFRVLFRGIIKRAHTDRRPLSVCLQLDPEKNNADDPQEVEYYLKKYFEGYRFDIYWGEIDEFAQELWERLGA